MLRNYTDVGVFCKVKMEHFVISVRKQVYRLKCLRKTITIYAELARSIKYDSVVFYFSIKGNLLYI